MDKKHILEEIKRTAMENNGKPLGRQKFENETAIKFHDWYGKYWAKWSDAIKEAGFTPNEFQKAFPDEFLLGKLCELIRELGHFPTMGELRLKAYNDKTFPSDRIFDRIGNKQVLISKVITNSENKNMEDIINLVIAFPENNLTF